MKMVTINDAYTAADGVRYWEWGGNASYEGFVKYLWNNYDEYNGEDLPLIEYLVSVGEDPANYSLDEIYVRTDSKLYKDYLNSK